MIRKTLLSFGFVAVCLGVAMFMWNTMTGAPRHAERVRSKMDYAALNITDPNGTRHGILAKVADTPTDRAVGFSHMSATRLRSYYLWMPLKKPSDRAWKSTSKKHALGIAWVDGSGEVVDMGRLTPAKPRAAPDRAVSGALEGGVRSMKRLGIKVGTDIDNLKSHA